MIEPAAELVEDLEQLRLGDLVKREGRRTWCVFVEPASIARARCTSVEVSVSVEALRIAPFDDIRQNGAGVWSLARFARRVLPLPLLRSADPVEALATAEVDGVVAALLAFHQRILAHDARRTWTTAVWLERALLEAAWAKERRRLERPEEA